MDFCREQTIAARASAAGSAIQAIIRVSGPGCRRIVEQVFTPREVERFPPTRFPERHVGRVRLRHSRTPVPAAAWFWPTDRSYTGEPLCELRLPGAAPFVEATLEELFRAGAQPARAGEFTLRAFLARRIDLLQAEAVLGVIDAPDEDHLKASLSQLAGGLSGAIAALHEQLLLDLADLEAGLDFVEEDLEFVDRERMRERLESAAAVLDRLQQQNSGRMHTAPVARVVLAGLPNAGKSTLFNALLKRDSAIVSSRSGTTRDYLTGRAMWSGWVVEFVDTPGFDSEANELMRSAFALRDAAIRGADLVVWCRASDLKPLARERDGRERERTVSPGIPTIDVTTKSDLDGSHHDPSALSVCALSGPTVEQFRRTLLRFLKQKSAPAQELIGSTAARCADSIRLAREAVCRACRLVQENAGDELVAAEIRVAVDEIGRVTGRVHSEDILDRVFSRFCIGK